ncbi:28S ribosomal protein S35, mitochondrial-like isoform X2 [Mytilus californianus]|uniref:28S ribosomal protein S35, mitochondrial-like isoform X2 n=2 Tax=Mytilus californianus TaxID=6549 RepID=UPI0022451505|nr:28S ribosomal protein S35, mitochondrial-like isoform X2 [Mytilus californianus]
MSSLTVKKHAFCSRFFVACCRLQYSSSAEKVQEQGQKENFRQLKIAGVHEIKERIQRTRFQRVRQPPRHLKMKVDQDWTNVWPTAHSFKWSVVPFPVRQGHVKNLAENEGMIPEKYGNLELMKIPNFLHLTPLHIKKQCQALKELCTPWPEGLEGQEMNRLFPLESETNDYCFASNNIRDPRARNVTVKFDVAHLKLTKAAKRKFLHLVGDRYDSVNNEVTLTSDRCPLKAQNFDYIMYLITVLYHESLVKEPWEDEITLEDMSRIPWKYSSSRKNLVKMLAATNNINIKDENLTQEDQEKLKQLDSEIDEKYKAYKSTVLNLVNAGETEKNIENYKNSVLELMNLPKFEVH